MTEAVRAVDRCETCGAEDDHPKLHYAMPTGMETYHHDCMPFKVIRDLTTYGYWAAEEEDAGGGLFRKRIAWVDGPEIPRTDLPKQIAEALAVKKMAEGGLRGVDLAKHITSGKPLTVRGGSGTSGLTSTEAALILHVLCPDVTTGTLSYSVVTPLKVLFLSAIRTANNGSDTEWSTSGGYTAGTGFSGLTFTATATANATGATISSNLAATITNAPAQTWAGCRVRDSTGTPKEIWYAPVSPSKTVNAGDTVTVPSGQFTCTLG